MPPAVTTIIEIRQRRGGWKVFEAAGVEPVFLVKDQVLNYAHNRASLRSGEIRLLDLALREKNRLQNAV
jgi:hypothetical protein